jgi:hypothetical protein
MATIHRFAERDLRRAAIRLDSGGPSGLVTLTVKRPRLRNR